MDTHTHKVFRNTDNMKIDDYKVTRETKQMHTTIFKIVVSKIEQVSRFYCVKEMDAVFVGKLTKRKLTIVCNLIID